MNSSYMLFLRSATLLPHCLGLDSDNKHHSDNAAAQICSVVIFQNKSSDPIGVGAQRLFQGIFQKVHQLRMKYTNASKWLHSAEDQLG